jgi:Sap-like sulfolipid-1-addressing protein
LGWIDAELVLVSLSAALSPTTLTFSVLTLVLGDRPLRTGFLFYLGAFAATLGVGVLAAFVLGDTAATSHPSTPKTWVAILDIVFALAILVFVVRWLRKPTNPAQTDAAVAQISRVVSSRAVAVIGAGAVLANPGMFIPIALKTISELDPSTAQYVVDWVFFALVSLLPLALALIAILVARDWAGRVLERVRAWLERNVRIVAAVIVIGLALTLLRNGISGLTG